jgi:hypothetical protein
MFQEGNAYLIPWEESGSSVYEFLPDFALYFFSLGCVFHNETASIDIYTFLSFVSQSIELSNWNEVMGSHHVCSQLVRSDSDLGIQKYHCI